MTLLYNTGATPLVWSEKEKTGRPIEYGETLALSLINYAMRESTFGEALMSMLDEYRVYDSPLRHLTVDDTFDVSSDALVNAEVILPENTEDAIHRGLWTLGRIADGTLPGHERARMLLREWARTKGAEDPKVIVIGMVIGIIPPVGMGHIKRKKKLSVILRNDHAGNLNDTKSGTLLAEKVAQANVGIVIRALGMTKGNIRILEPEIADWLFGERAMRFYRADDRTLAAIEKELRALNIIYATAEEEGRVGVLALSPALHSTYQETHWNITPIE